MTWFLIITLYQGGVGHIEYPTKDQCEAAAVAFADNMGVLSASKAFCITGPDWSAVDGYVQE